MLAAAAIVLAINASQAADTLETRVASALNAVRANPEAFRPVLDVYLRRFVGDDVRIPESDADEATEEGPAAVEEAIQSLGRLEPRRALTWDPQLAQTAAEHASDQATTGLVGHQGSDGEDFATRVTHHLSGRRLVSEVISYGETQEDDVVRQLIVDDGVPGREHRRDVFDADIARVGVACRPHPVYGYSCVIDLSS